MAYKSLYRVYRPKTFDDVSGQEHITDILKNQIKAGKSSHAYLFCGPRGTGKTSTAKIFANALNCLNPQDGNPCLNCEVCESVRDDAFVDIVEIDAASNNGVDNVREIREKVALLPVHGKYKVYIIDEVHMLSTGAFNALLKTLEEPPPHAVFILATTEIRKVPATILSRCQRYDFKRVADADIIARLAYVAGESGAAYKDDALSLIARQAEGSLRDALSIMDQCISSGAELSSEGVSEAIGIADTAVLSELTDAIMSEDAGRALGLLNNLLYEGVSAHNLLRDLISALSTELANNASNAYKCSCILRSLEALIASQTNMRYTAVPSAVLTAAVARAAVNTADADTQDFELRIRKLEERVERMADGVPAAQAIAHQTAAPPKPVPFPKAEPENVQSTSVQPTPAEKVEQAHVPSTPVEAAQPEKPSAKQVPIDNSAALDQLRKALTKKNMTLLPAANAIKSVALDGGSLTLTFDENDAFMANMLRNGVGKDILAEIVAGLYGDAHVKIIEEKHEEKNTDKDDIASDLFEIFGEENVKIIE